MDKNERMSLFIRSIGELERNKAFQEYWLVRVREKRDAMASEVFDSVRPEGMSLDAWDREQAERRVQVRVYNEILGMLARDRSQYESEISRMER